MKEKRNKRCARKQNDNGAYMRNKTECLNAIKPLGTAKFLYDASERASIKTTVSKWNRKVGQGKGMHLICRFYESTSTVVITDDAAPQLSVIDSSHEEKCCTMCQQEHLAAKETTSQTFKVLLDGKEYEVEDIPLTTTKIAKLLGVTENAVHHMYKRKEKPLPHRKFGRKNVVWLKAFLLWFEPQYGQPAFPSNLIEL